MIESIRKDKKSVLLLDCGEVFGSQTDHANAELHLKSMEKMGYDALNLGILEVSYGKEFLDRARSGLSFPYIASNLLYNGGRLPWILEYVIKDVGGIKAAILGVLNPEDFKKIRDRDGVKGFEAISPETALRRLLPEVRGKADLVILLSQLGELGQIKTIELVEAVQGIDVAIFSEMNYLAAPPHKTVTFHTGTEGQIVGLATITLSDKGVRSVSEQRPVQMGVEVPENKEILALIENYTKGRK